MSTRTEARRLPRAVLQCATAASFALSLAVGTAAAQVGVQTFEDAIRDAAVAEPDEIVTDLFAINTYNPYLIWRNHDGQSQVLVLSWMSRSKLEQTFGASADVMAPEQAGAAPENRDIWITAVPQVRDTCASWGLSGEDLELRLKQFLGLNAEWSYYALVEMWVSPRDIYRPCPDPEIGDTACTLPEVVEGHFGAPADPAFTEWFTNLESISYGPNGAPWTRLGYTYDWGNPDSNVGASEYLIAPSATVMLASINETPDEYCVAE